MGTKVKNEEKLTKVEETVSVAKVLIKHGNEFLLLKDLKLANPSGEDWFFPNYFIKSKISKEYSEDVNEEILSDLKRDLGLNNLDLKLHDCRKYLSKDKLSIVKIYIYIAQHRESKPPKITLKKGSFFYYKFFNVNEIKKIKTRFWVKECVNKLKKDMDL